MADKTTLPRKPSGSGKALAAILLAATLNAAAPAIAAPSCLAGDSAVDVATTEWAKTCAHPLCGFVYPAAKANREHWGACRRDTWRPLLDHMRDAERTGGIVMLGEIHDNPEHHKLRAILLEQASAAVFEQIRADQQPALDKYVVFNKSAARLGNTSDLLRFLDWDKTSWSKTSDYRPLFEAVVRARLPIYPGDPPRDVMRKTAKEGASALPDDERKRLGLEASLGEAQDAASLAEIDGSHCGMIPKSAQPNMAVAQRYRDAHMADMLLKAAEAHGSAILFAGNGHVRTDRGVPWYIRLRAPSKAVVAVMLVEVVDGKTDPETYVPRDPDGKPATDFIVFTPRGPDRDKDPCEGMKAPAPK